MFRQQRPVRASDSSSDKLFRKGSPAPASGEGKLAVQEISLPRPTLKLMLLIVLSSLWPLLKTLLVQKRQRLRKFQTRCPERNSSCVRVLVTGDERDVLDVYAFAERGHAPAEFCPRFVCRRDEGSRHGS
jgi:hypothetical protein